MGWTTRHGRITRGCGSETPEFSSYGNLRYGRLSEETKYYLNRLRDPGISISLSRGDEEGSGDAGHQIGRPMSVPLKSFSHAQLTEDEALGTWEMPLFPTRDKHWICWDTGELEPPGLQTRLIQPWPTPVPPGSPPSSELQKGGRLLSRRSQGGVRQRQSLAADHNLATSAGEQRIVETHRGFPVFGDAYADRSKFRNRNVTFYDQPSAVDRDEQTLLTIAPTFRAWHTVDRGYDKAASFRRRPAASHNVGMSLYQHPVNKHPADLERSYRGHASPAEFYGLSPRGGSAAQSFRRGNYVKYNGYYLDLETSGRGYFQPPVEYYPLSHHPTRKSDAETYVHHESQFTHTQPTQRGFFIIHPDWVSERQGMKPKSAKHFTSSKGPNAFRYGSQ